MILRYISITKYLLILLIFLIAGKANSQDGIVVDEIIAKVDNHIVLKSDLELAYLDMITRGQATQPNTKCAILENLIVSKLLLAKAEIDSVVVLDVEVESSLDRKLRYFVAQIGSEEKLEEYYDKSIDQFKEELREQEREQLLIQRMQENITKGVSITPAEVRKFFNNIPRDSLPYFSKEVIVGEIVIYPKPGKKPREAAKKLLFELKDRIIKGADFNALAREYSDEPIAVQTGGELGFYRRGELAPEYEAAALNLEEGGISDPVESQFGIHLIQLIRRRGNEYNSRHILITPEPTQQDIQRAKNKLDSIRNLIINDSITFEKAAKEFSENKATSANGGFLTDDSGVPRVSVEQLDPSTFFTIDTMSVGSISKPIEYQAQQDKKAVRILYYKDHVPPHQANLNDDWQKIKRAALNQKKNRVLADWFNKARHDVFINIDGAYDYCNILN